jgi:hypothetical protein
MHKIEKSSINEGLLRGDLKQFVSDVFTVDRYTSKMGEDRDIVVLGFRVKEKFPAVDLMEFIERGYPYILDADISTGEEDDGQYQVFVEIERNHDLTKNLKNLLAGISQLTDHQDWKFRYQKDNQSKIFDEQSIMETIPMSPDEYDKKITEIKNLDIQEFFDQGAAEVHLDSNNELTFSKPYSGDVSAKFVAIGNYDDVKRTLPGALNLDESSISQTAFLNKYIGNYDISKISNKFLIRNGNRAVIIEKNRW